MYKMVILDLDGTLLNSDKNISEYTLNTIKELSGKVKFVLASARAYITIKPYVEQLDLLNNNNYTIAFNGSLIVDNLENVVIDEEISNREKHLLQQYINNNYQVEWHYYTYNENILINDILDIYSFIDKNEIYKIVCIATEYEIMKMRNNMPQDINNLFEITSSEPTRIEFVKKGMKKIKAIKLLLDKLKIDPSEVIAIGDGENDIDMIKLVGCGVAMGNAMDDVKLVADIITDTNDNNGVAKILKKLIK